jgi:hypothetical protein
MINYEKLHDINTNTTEGQLLLAAIAILTSIDHKHITSGKWGGTITPDTAVKKITELANKIYHEEEYNKEQQRIERDNKINKILRNE